MCGIIGYIGKKQALPILIEGLKRLEYRGYDSCGYAILNNNGISCKKAVGKIENLEKIMNDDENCVIGIAHTRWATHGTPTEENAHPHFDCSRNIALVHNGIIENYNGLKKKLEEKGHKFFSQTDSEVLAHLIEENFNGDLLEAVRKSLSQVVGTYGLAVISKKDPKRIIAARLGSPLIVGVGEDELFVASDVSAILKYTQKVIYLEDGEIAEINSDGIKTYDFENKLKDKKIDEITWSAEDIQKQGFDHFMLKEIFEQPETIKNALRGRINYEQGSVNFGGLNLTIEYLQNIDRIVIIACGTARFAGLVGEYLLEEYVKIPTEVEFSSEFRYRNPIISDKTLVVVISQSGETADTLAALREAKKKGAKTLGIINVVGSTIAREVDGGIYTHAGPEIAVASTKAFTSQVAVMVLLAVLLGRLRTISVLGGQKILKELEEIPDKINQILKMSPSIQELAKKYNNFRNVFFLGRRISYPSAEEGALKLTEVAYSHAEAYPSAEMKHGPIALIDENFLSVFVAPKDDLIHKTLSNIEEIKARNGKVLVIATEGDEEISKKADDVIFIPETLEMLSPLLAVIPLQLFAYHTAVLRNYDVDKPRNLAKSVTVE